MIHGSAYNGASLSGDTLTSGVITEGVTGGVHKDKVKVQTDYGYTTIAQIALLRKLDRNTGMNDTLYFYTKSWLADISAPSND